MQLCPGARREDEAPSVFFRSKRLDAPENPRAGEPWIGMSERRRRAVSLNIYLIKHFLDCAPRPTKHFFSSVGGRPGIELNHRLGPPAHLWTTNTSAGALLPREGLAGNPTVHVASFPAGDSTTARCRVLPRARDLAVLILCCRAARAKSYGRGKSRSSGGAISVTRSRIRTFFGNGASAVTPSFSRTVQA
jgi:hypothetical protein